MHYLFRVLSILYRILVYLMSADKIYFKNLNMLDKINKIVSKIVCSSVLC